MTEKSDAFAIGSSPSCRLLCGCTPNDLCRLGVEIADAWLANNALPRNGSHPHN